MSEKEHWTADDLRYWAEYMDNPAQCRRPRGISPNELYHKTKTAMRGDGLGGP